jgi:hypothetical protein
MGEALWVPRNLSNHMVRRARTGDTVLAKSREMTGRSQLLPLLAERNADCVCADHLALWLFRWKILDIKAYNMPSLPRGGGGEGERVGEGGGTIQEYLLLISLDRC